MNEKELPVAVIGAGPIGLAAAVHLLRRGETPLVFEAGATVASAVQSWAHVTLFSPWEYNVDPVAAELLAETGWQRPPAKQLPTGGDLIGQYLAPLAALPALKPHIHYNALVTGVSRQRHDKMKDHRRAKAPFILQVLVEGQPQRFLARAVIDASGSWRSPNPLGADGLTAPGEKAYAANIFYGIPDILGNLRQRYADRRVAVVGGGHSAINALLELTDLQADAPGTTIHWILRKRDVAAAYGGLGADALPGRGQLGLSMKAMVDTGRVQVHTPFYVTEIGESEAGLLLAGETPAGPASILVDEIIAATGARPDLSFLREIRHQLDPGIEAPPALAPLIDPNIHSCGTVRPHGEAELRQPEPGFYIVGMKSYGRAPTFLLATGYEQVRSVVAALVGDMAAARKVELILPETGVCGVSLGSGDSCCAPAPVVQLQALQVAEKCCEPAPAGSSACCMPL